MWHLWLQLLSKGGCSLRKEAIQMWYLWIQMFCKEWYEQTLLNWFMKRKSHSNVTFVIIAFIKVWHVKTVHEEYISFKCNILERTLWMYMLYLFMKEKVIYIHHWIMKGKSHSNVKFVIKVFIKGATWNSMLQQFMKDTNHLMQHLWLQMF